MSASLVKNFGEPIVLRRFEPGVYVKGKYVEGGFEETEIIASVQPSIPDETNQENVGRRNSHEIRIYCHTELRTTDEERNRRADIVVWRNNEFEVQRVDNWFMQGLPHWRAYALQLNELDSEDN